MSEVMIDTDLQRAADISAINLKETAEALQPVIEGMEGESHTSVNTSEEEKLRAIIFAKRMPMYLATLNVILRDIETQTDDMRRAVGDSFDKKRQEKEGADVGK